ncbi:MAG: lipid-A-disaccharide synthase [Deltaproteobacteria bacterium]|nr:lipid-A-disaccharide synthase [Deltaproteobacteria bacterium]
MTKKQSEKRKVLIVAGEDSGDLHGANLIAASHRIDPDLKYYGVGGKRMAAAGCDIILPSSELSVVGFVEVLRHLPVIRKAFRRLKSILQGDQPPDLLITVDFPEFNLRLDKVAKKAGIPVLHFVSPQVWAWRRGRIRKISRIVDKLAVILPFEAELYKPYGLDAEYVGNPLVDDFEIRRNRNEFRADHNIEADVPVIGLFPGSRRSELRYMLATIMETAQKILDKKPDSRFLFPVAPSLEEVDFSAYGWSKSLPIEFVKGENIYEVAKACDAVICVSGTVTLQVALAGTPMAIIYKLSPLTYWLGRLLIRVPFIGLANIVAGKRVAREFIQEMANPANISSEILRILDDREYNQKIREAIDDVKEKLGQGGCSERVAQIASAMTKATF